MESNFLNISYHAIKDTIEAFFKHPFGFHGDTSIRDYLFYKLMFYGNNNFVYPQTHSNGLATLLLQSEHYTSLLYQNTGNNPSSGRFDLAIVNAPKEINYNELHCNNLKPLIAFEIGKNKSEDAIIGNNILTLTKEDTPRTADLLKIYRELKYTELKHGFVLEFFDNEGIQPIIPLIRIKKLFDEEFKLHENKTLNIFICIFSKNDKPFLLTYHMKLQETLNINCDYSYNDYYKKYYDENIFKSSKGNITYEEFIKSCSDKNKEFQKIIYEKLNDRFNLRYGSKTMTINYDGNRLLRIGNKLDKFGERIYEISEKLNQVINELKSKESLYIDNLDNNFYNNLVLKINEIFIA